MERLSNNWHLVRILQLVMGLVLVGSYVFYMQDGITLAFGLILLLQAAFNVSCVTGACSVPDRQQSAADPENKELEVEYDEIVPSKGK